MERNLYTLNDSESNVRTGIERLLSEEKFSYIRRDESKQLVGKQQEIRTYYFYPIILAETVVSNLSGLLTLKIYTIDDYNRVSLKLSKDAFLKASKKILTSGKDNCSIKKIVHDKELNKLFDGTQAFETLHHIKYAVADYTNQMEVIEEDFELLNNKIVNDSYRYILITKNEYESQYSPYYPR